VQSITWYSCWGAESGRKQSHRNRDVVLSEITRFVMEGLAASSSVAGVLSLAVQTIDGISKLHRFFKDVAVASEKITQFK
jgi:hypothetical protein